MSSRALRRLQEEQEQNEQTLNNEVVGVGSKDEEEEYESEDDHDRINHSKKITFNLDVLTPFKQSHLKKVIQII